jgi:hypothetical protein
MSSELRKQSVGRPRVRFQPDLRLTIRFRTGRDDDLLAWLEELPDRQRAGIIRQMLRASLNGSAPGRTLERQGPASDEGRGEGDRLSAV